MSATSTSGPQYAEARFEGTGQLQADSVHWCHLNVSDTAGVAYQAARAIRALDQLGTTGVKVTVGLELLPPLADAEVPSQPSPSANIPSTSPAPRRPSDAAVKQCFLDIMEERPDDPLSEKDLLAEMKRRLGASPGRQRVRDLWRVIAPGWKKPRGHPRNKISAKKPAV